MKAIVLGSGVLGTTTAYYLAKQGHEVVVIDRQEGPALETSFANAGEVSPGYSAPWAAPGVPVKAVKWMFMKHAPLILRPHLDPFQWRWMASMLANCTSARYAVNKGRMVRLAEYSRDVLRELRADTGIAYDERTKGTLQLFRKQQQVDASAADMAVLDEYKVPYEALDVDGCVRVEPGLAYSRDRIVGGLLLPGDETGDLDSGASRRYFSGTVCRPWLQRRRANAGSHRQRNYVAALCRSRSFGRPAGQPGCGDPPAGRRPVRARPAQVDDRFSAGGGGRHGHRHRSDGGAGARGL